LETKLLHFDSALAQSRAKVVCEQGELVRPDTGRHSQKENASRERDRYGFLGNPGADSFTPHVASDG
jgi:hypothetical protein